MSVVSAPQPSKHFHSGDLPAPGVAAPSPARIGEPFVFDAGCLWQHERPLLEVLATLYGDLPLAALVGSYGWVLKYDQQAKARALGIGTLGDYLALFGRAPPGTLPYLTHLSVNRLLPALRPWFAQPREFRPNWVSSPWLDRLGGPEIFLGPKGSGFAPIHVDHAAVHVGFWQIAGVKEFLLYPPSDGRYLYRYRGAQFPYQLRNSRVHTANARDYGKFPLLRQAHPRRVVLRAGQGLFLPANWWHGTINREDSVSYSIRIVNHTNVLATLAAYALGPVRALLKAAGR